jgi:hypothetical protein
MQKPVQVAPFAAGSVQFHVVSGACGKPQVMQNIRAMHELGTFMH